MTCGLAALALVGPQARELLARFCAIDVRPALAPVGGFRPGSVARTPGYLLRERPDSAADAGRLGARRVPVGASSPTRPRHLGGGPVGAEALGHHLDSDDA